MSSTAVARTGRGNAVLIALTLLAVALFCVAVYAIIQAAGGVDLSPFDSNTPNAVVPGPPAAR